MIKFFLLITLIVNILNVGAQESEESNSPFHKLGIVMGNHHVQKGVKEGNSEWLILSSWGLNYSYNLNNKWAIGINSDIILGDYEVKTFRTDNEKVVERSYPITIALNGYYKPLKNLSFLFGSGIETSKEDNFYLLRIGIDYGWEIGKNLELSINLDNELKVEEYNSWSFGVGLSKKIF